MPKTTYSIEFENGRVIHFFRKPCFSDMSNFSRCLKWLEIDLEKEGRPSKLIYYPLKYSEAIEGLDIKSYFELLINTSNIKSFCKFFPEDYDRDELKFVLDLDRPVDEVLLVCTWIRYSVERKSRVDMALSLKGLGYNNETSLLLSHYITTSSKHGFVLAFPNFGHDSCPNLYGCDGISFLNFCEGGDLKGKQPSFTKNLIYESNWFECLSGNGDTHRELPLKPFSKIEDAVEFILEIMKK